MERRLAVELDRQISTCAGRRRPLRQAGARALEAMALVCYP